MKKLLQHMSVALIALLSALPLSVIAFQGGFGGPAFRLGEVGNGQHWLIGAKGAGFVSDSLYIGGAGYTLVDQIKKSPLSNKRLNFSYGGLLLGNRYWVGLAQFVTLEALIGAGHVNWGERLFDSHTENASQNGDGASVAVVELALMTQAHWVPWMTTGVGLGYRWTRNMYSRSSDVYPKLEGFHLEVMLGFGG